MGNDKNLHIKTESVMFLNPRGMKWLTVSEKGNLSVDVNVASHRERERERKRKTDRVCWQMEKGNQTEMPILETLIIYLCVGHLFNLKSYFSVI